MPNGMDSSYALSVKMLPFAHGIHCLHACTKCSVHSRCSRVCLLKYTMADETSCASQTQQPGNNSYTAFAKQCLKIGLFKPGRLLE